MFSLQMSKHNNNHSFVALLVSTTFLFIVKKNLIIFSILNSKKTESLMICCLIFVRKKYIKISWWRQNSWCQGSKCLKTTTQVGLVHKIVKFPKIPEKVENKSSIKKNQRHWHLHWEVQSQIHKLRNDFTILI